ncbi:MAG: LamB/YcsF family protein, partial [Desulfatiglandales bacterium]
EVIRHITSANIACGWHAGDPVVMDYTVRLAKRHNVGVGAHPGYPDLMGFGRRNMSLGRKEITTYVAYQVGALWAFSRMHSVRLQHVKAHGALYNTAVDDPYVARAVAEAVLAIDPQLIFVGLAGPKGHNMRRVAMEMGLRVAFEAFPDRNYTPEGTLVPRKYENAVIHDPELVKERAIMMAKEQKVVAVDRSVIPLEVHTLCVHGDNPKALALVAGIREALTKEGLTLAPMDQVLKGV